MKHWLRNQLREHVKAIWKKEGSFASSRILPQIKVKPLRMGEKAPAFSALLHGSSHHCQLQLAGPWLAFNLQQEQRHVGRRSRRIVSVNLYVADTHHSIWKYIIVPGTWLPTNHKTKQANLETNEVCERLLLWQSDVYIINGILFLIAWCL